MRTLLLTLVIVVGETGFGTRAEAQNYPWCASYSDKGGQNCGFVSFEQCMTTMSGIGGFCNQNTQYVASTPRAMPQARKRR
jgi:hypothetical protein